MDTCCNSTHCHPHAILQHLLHPEVDTSASQMDLPPGIDKRAVESVLPPRDSYQVYVASNVHAVALKKNTSF